MAAVILAAIVAQFVKSTDSAAALGRDVGTTVANFFSFFTILSNLSAATVLAWAAIWWFTRGRNDSQPRSLAVALACVTTYMAVTGIVYNTLLRNVELPQGSEAVPWSNEVLHLIGPAFLVVDLVVGPPRRRLGWKTILLVIGFPIAWVVYTLVRGPLTTNPATGDDWWYPYPFLDPHGPGGYPSVAVYVLAIAVVFTAVAAGVVWVDRRRAADLPG
ncbi:Pr6Pr family membrane protein [Gordonia araii NBRC 100433]|nr:Pr6Pr family membrane protein [Gordonia araii NBRC 100433]